MSRRSAIDLVNARPPRANIRVPSIPPERPSATSVVPPPPSTNSPPARRIWSEPRTRPTAAPLHPKGMSKREAVERGPDDGGMDEPDVDVRQAGLPGDRPLGLAKR